MALMSTERMEAAARQIAVGTTSTTLINEWADVIRKDPAVNTTKLSEEELRKLLSIELSRANPRSSRYAAKYDGIHQLVREELDNELEELKMQLRNAFLEKLNADIDSIGELAQAHLTAAGGENNELKLANSPDESDKLIARYTKLVELQYKLELARLATVEKMAHGPYSNIVDASPKL